MRGVKQKNYHFSKPGSFLRTASPCLREDYKKERNKLALLIQGQCPVSGSLWSIPLDLDRSWISHPSQSHQAGPSASLRGGDVVARSSDLSPRVACSHLICLSGHRLSLGSPWLGVSLFQDLHQNMARMTDESWSVKLRRIFSDFQDETTRLLAWSPDS